MIVSILMPFYNRRNFIPLIIQNVKNQTFPADKLRLIIDDDSEQSLEPEEIQHIAEQISPTQLIYVKTPRKTIGKKRNDMNKYVLKNYGKNSIVANMDTDDLYNPIYIENGVKQIIKEGFSCVGSSEMLFTYPYDNYKMTFIRCNNIKLIHEASMIHTTQFWRASGGYNNNMTGEGTKLLSGFNSRLILDESVKKIMVCVSHNNNTIDKSKFSDNRFNIGQKLHFKDQELIDKCLDLPTYRRAPDFGTYIPAS